MVPVQAKILAYHTAHHQCVDYVIFHTDREIQNSGNEVDVGQSGSFYFASQLIHHMNKIC